MKQRSETEWQDLGDKVVRHNVLVLVSGAVEALIQARYERVPECLKDLVEEFDLEGVDGFSCPAYNLDIDECMEWLRANDVDEGDWPDKDDEDEYAWRQCVEDNWRDPEVYEYYIVDRDFAHRLRDIGEIVFMDTSLGNVWGRTTTGQRICLDQQLRPVFDEMAGWYD